MSNLLAYRNGELVPQNAAGLSLHDAGFVQGATVTDLVRTFRHQPFRLTEHLSRFRQSCHLAKIPLLAEDTELERAARDLLARNSAGLAVEQDLGLVMFATPGPIGWYLGERTPGTPTLGMHTFPLPVERYRNQLRNGATLLIPSIRHLPAESIDRRIKHRSRLFWRLAELEVQERQPHANALLLDTDGSLTETAAANVVLVCAGVVLSPPGSRILPGVSLGFLRELCVAEGIPFAERDLWPEDCVGASEAFLTCTSFCLAPVASIEGHTFSPDRPLFNRLLKVWSERVGVDLREQILAGG